MHNESNDVPDQNTEGRGKGQWTEVLFEAFRLDLVVAELSRRLEHKRSVATSPWE
jgi:hypothetical protein